MPQTELYNEDGRQGFTLIELLIAMALALVIIASLATSFVSQRKAFDVQQQMTELNQNARAAMDIMSRDIMMVGYGLVKSNGNYTNLSSIDWAGSGINFSNQPFIIQSGNGVLGSDIIYIAGCIDSTQTILSSAASQGATTLSVASGGIFNSTTKKLICISGIENAVVTGTSGNSINVDTDPPNGSGLRFGHSKGAPVCLVKVISYSIVRDDDGSYILKRNEHLGAGRQPLAENIVDLGITQSGNRIEIDPLTAQTDKRDPNYSQHNGYRRRSFRSFLTPPNLTAGN
jgi:prepilin-type N-terminal cleavage/methylation domain-containing protein